MVTVPDDLRQRLRQYQQEHVLAFWDQLNDEDRSQLLAQLADVDLAQLQALYTRRDKGFPLPLPEKIAPVPVVHRHYPEEAADRVLGEESLRRGEVAILVVAGGQGSRLGFKMPKGMFPVGPVSNKTLFQVHAEKVLALCRKYGVAIPFLIMTSPATDADTRAYFAKQGYFGLPPADVHFFCQGTMPALDLATGRLLLENPGRLFLSPDGHGGTLIALIKTGLLSQLQQRGVKHLYYFQVDNPLVEVAHPVFLGLHIRHRSEASSKIIGKLNAADKLGNFTQVDGRCTIIEYSDLPRELAEQTDERGKLRLWAGSPAIHLFEIDFLARVAALPEALPFHIAKKKVPCLDDKGMSLEPTKENALKFERFIFDVLPLADRWLLVETTREDEFAPLKNDTGPDSPETVTRAISNLAAHWLEKNGITVPRDDEGRSEFLLEISPLFALEPRDLVGRVERTTRIVGPRYFE